ncbi:hypothetical protein FF38_10576, partial [Lucilia cuprina]
MENPQNTIQDILKIYLQTNEDETKMAQLIELHLKQLKITQNEPNTNSTALNAKGSSKENAKPSPQKPKTKKKSRKWDQNDFSSDEEFDPSLDFSGANAQDLNLGNLSLEDVDAKELGKDSKEGFLVKELSDELGDILSNNDDEDSSEQFGFLKNLVGGKKLDEKALRSSLVSMEDHLVAKNVAKDVASAICDQVCKDLKGTSTKNWTTVKTTVKETAARRILNISAKVYLVFLTTSGASSGHAFLNLLSHSKECLLNISRILSRCFNELDTDGVCKFLSSVILYNFFS